MEKYLLQSEKEKLNNLITLLSKSLNIDKIMLNNLNKLFHKIIIITKDNSIEDILETYFNFIQIEMEKLLNEKITPGLQFGIKNKIFKITGYSGNKNITTNEEITENTYFSFDSISKLITSTIIAEEIRNKKANWNTPINEYNNNFLMDATIESILKFTAMIRTEKRIENLNNEETIEILKKCKEILKEKKYYKNFYEYNDIGLMILRLSIPNFQEKLDNLLNKIDNINLTYNYKINKDNITSGKKYEEYITQDLKGRNIIFPGHTGLYGNINGLLNLYEKLLFEDTILTKEDKIKLFTQPYEDPIIYTKEGNILLGNNQKPKYMAKIAGIYRKPNNITDIDFDKLSTCDMSNLTSSLAKASAGTCGSWVIGDDLSYQNKFGTYIGGLLTNPYSYIEKGLYPEITTIKDTNLTINQRGKIIEYPKKLNYYKEKITEYGLLILLITEYIKETDKNILTNKQYQLTKKIN